MAQLLLELFSEEIPARMQVRAGEELARLVGEALTEAGLRFDSATHYSGPRRLALVIEGLPEQQADTVEEKRGPRADAPDKAVEGFLNANGLKREDLETRETERGAFLFAVIERKGGATIDILPALLAGAIHRLPWAKSMRWGAGRMRWVRPLQGMLCLLDSDLVPVDLGEGIVAGNRTRGHRFMGPEPFEVGFFNDYAATLRRNKVIVDADERRSIIDEQAKALAVAAGFAVRRDNALRMEVSGLVEWPVCLMGSIDAAFMTLPDEVLTTSMRAHQKYFAVEAEDGSLAPHFIVVANIEAADGGKAIVAGNERVLRARLADAKFFWDQDRKVALFDRRAALEDVVFHARLGSVADKVKRIEALATKLMPHLGLKDDALETVRRAAALAKADLTTGMVGEFPELQGVMGRYYALDEGEPAEIADAIRDHYSPAGQGDDCPTAPVSVAVALADRLDTLAGFWAIGETPTGSRDPYALRRAALGVIRLVLENNLRLPLVGAMTDALNFYAEDVRGGRDEDVVASLLAFFVDRMKVHLRERGVRHDLVSAVFALPGQDDMRLIVSRVEALQTFLDGEDGRNLLAAYRRATNIVAIEEKKDGVAYGGDVDTGRLVEDQEKAFWKVLGEATDGAANAIDGEDFRNAMAAMSQLKAPVDAFFEKVTVNVEQAELRANRLNLLAKFRATLNGVADFSLIEG
jgi:glycyl-tRNA synthetase beta chain